MHYRGLRAVVIYTMDPNSSENDVSIQEVDKTTFKQLLSSKFVPSSKKISVQPDFNLLTGRCEPPTPPPPEESKFFQFSEEFS